MNPLLYILTLGFILLHCLLLFLLSDSFSAESLTCNGFVFLGKQSLCTCGDDVLSPLPNVTQFVLSVLHFLQVSCKLALRGKRHLISVSTEGKLSKVLTPILDTSKPM